MGSLGLVLDLAFFQETYHPIILRNKARELRRRTGNWGIYAQHETIELDIRDIVTKNLVRPLYMLVVEPILLLITIYTAFIYGILYLCLEAYPIIFSRYGFKGGVTELPYLSLLIGEILGALASIFIFEPMYIKAMKKTGNKIVPENRLPPMMVGGICFPIGIFWLCWTGAYSAHVHWIVPTIAGAFIGGSLLLIFLPAINYVVDSYLLFAASALAGNTFLRSTFGAVFPLFATQMFNGMHIQWAGTLIGLIGLLLAPVPFLFFKFGKSIRRRSKYAFDL
jgi:DHA1 family multidrug resistance protein-like MFS transporter